MAATDTPAAAAAEKRKSVAAVADNPVNDVVNATKANAVQLELANMRKMLEQLLHKMPAANKRHSYLLDLLLKNDVDMQIAENLLQGLPEEKSIIGSAQSIVRQLLLDRIKNHLCKTDGIQL